MAKANSSKPPKDTPDANDKSADPPESAKPGDEPPAPGAPDPAAPNAGADNDPPVDPPAAPSAPANKGGKPKPGGYVCVEPVKRGGKRYMPDDPIELTDTEAKPLLDQQAIQPA